MKHSVHSRICYVANIRLPTEKAHGIQIMKMCEAFVNTGVQVELVVPRRFNHVKENPFEYYGVKENFSIVYVPVFDLVFLGRIGFWVTTISFSISIFFYMLSKRVKIIYSRDEFPLWLVSFLKQPVVWEVHVPRDNFFVRALLRKVKRVVVISEGLRKFYSMRRGVENKIIVAHDGVDLSDFKTPFVKEDSRRSLGLPLNKNIVMYVGRIDDWKGVATLLEASRLMRDILVVIIGGGPLKRKLEQQYPNARFLGVLPYRQLPRNQKAADVLIVPNSSKSEVSRLYTSPLKVFAHMASSIPIVASDIPSIREVLNEGNAFLFKSDFPQDLARTVEFVLTNPDEAKSRAQKASRDVVDFTWEKRAERILSTTQDI